MVQGLVGIQSEEDKWDTESEAMMGIGDYISSPAHSSPRVVLNLPVFPDWVLGFFGNSIPSDLNRPLIFLLLGSFEFCNHSHSSFLDIVVKSALCFYLLLPMLFLFHVTGGYLDAVTKKTGSDKKDGHHPQSDFFS